MNILKAVIDFVIGIDEKQPTETAFTYALHSQIVADDPSDESSKLKFNFVWVRSDLECVSYVFQSIPDAVRFRYLHSFIPTGERIDIASGQIILNGIKDRLSENGQCKPITSHSLEQQSSVR